VCLLLTQGSCRKFVGVIKGTAGVELPFPERKTIDLEGRIVKDGVRKAVRDRQLALTDLVHAIKEYRKLAESTPLTLQGSPFAQAVLALNKAIERAELRCKGCTVRGIDLKSGKRMVSLPFSFDFSVCRSFCNSLISIYLHPAGLEPATL
jgi:hypothetical protein